MSAPASTEVAKRTPIQQLIEQVRRPGYLEEVRLALPGNVRPERFQRTVVTAILENPEVVVDPPSFLRSSIRAAQDGLLPDGREAAFVVVKEKGEKKVAYWPMIGGYRKIAAKHGFTLVADVVHENDEWDWSKMPPAVTHKPALRDRGEIICAYAAAFDKEWRFVAAPVVMDVPEIEKVRGVSRAAQSEYGPWVKWWERMAVKTVARRLFKDLPLGDLEEVDARIVEAADAEAEFAPAMTVDEADIAAGLSNLRPPTDSGPDDSAAKAPPTDALEDGADAAENGEAAAAVSSPAPAAAAADENVEDGDWQEATGDAQAATFDPATVAAAGAQQVPGGIHKGKTLADLAATEQGQQWLLMQLRRLAADDRMRPAIECYVEGALPDVWARYQA